MTATSVTLNHDVLCDLNELKALMSREEGRTLNQNEVISRILAAPLAQYREQARQQAAAKETGTP